MPRRSAANSSGATELIGSLQRRRFLLRLAQQANSYEPMEQIMLKRPRLILMRRGFLAFFSQVMGLILSQPLRPFPRQPLLPRARLSFLTAQTGWPQRKRGRCQAREVWPEIFLRATVQIGHQRPRTGFMPRGPRPSSTLEYLQSLKPELISKMLRPYRVSPFLLVEHLYVLVLTQLLLP